MLTTAEQLADALVKKGIADRKVLAAIRHIPRHLFVAPALTLHAYEDVALPTSHEQTISQPFVVARMTEILLAGHKIKKVLEIGTGSGYQTAVLAELVPQVYTIERIRSLYDAAIQRFAALNLTNIHARFDDGTKGWSAEAPFDGIIVTAGTEEVPQALLDQLTDGGRLVIPVGCYSMQELQLITRHADNYTIETFDPVIFVPLLKGTE